ncbi:hypothetical protein GBA63_17635 [Rubrobacter tropicus]|uniref:Uncharacterized protein n=1 Tax=Rubrobacter tropicus TaxID=2653851 RepID=A0A6G8QCV4_9ACTN|nr:hypothetical protein [Rubrobacter tropicus]QIN84268.1 hypothetical protein GBA63_17635 [Rubrobacter tropicus]
MRSWEGLKVEEAADRPGITVSEAYRLHKAALGSQRAALCGSERVQEEAGSAEDRSIEAALLAPARRHGAGREEEEADG